MNKSKVYIPHMPVRWDNMLERHEPVYDIRAAAMFGDIVCAVDVKDAKLSNSDMVAKVKEVLSDYLDGDFIVCIGDPSLIAAAIMRATQVSGGGVTVLKYERRVGAYYPIKL